MQVIYCSGGGGKEEKEVKKLYKKKKGHVRIYRERKN